jgi:hypothetical protein
MNNQTRQSPVPARDLPGYFGSRGIPHLSLPRLRLGFGRGARQFRLYQYPAPADDETMGLFFDWHTEDFFDVDSGPHLAVGLWGPTAEEPHRGRGLAIGILANQTCTADDPDNPVELFRGCPDPPGGPACFIEDFSRNDGVAPVSDWQLSLGQPLPGLRGRSLYRVEVHVSAAHVWAGVWIIRPPDPMTGETSDRYELLGETACSACPQHPGDRGVGNAFIGAGFSDPETHSRVDHICIAHWKTALAPPFQAGDQTIGNLP